MKSKHFAAAIILAVLAGCSIAPEIDAPNHKPACDDARSAKSKDKDGGIGGTGRAPDDCHSLNREK